MPSKEIPPRPRVSRPWKFSPPIQASEYHLINLATGAVEHPFGTLKMRMGATHFLMKRPPKVATEMALHVTQNDLWSFRSVSRPRNRRKSQSARLRVLASQSEVGFWTRSETFLRNQDPQET
jgi:hypothetical protein